MLEVWAKTVTSYKHIAVSKEVWQRLGYLKFRLDKKSMNDTIEYVLNMYWVRLSTHYKNRLTATPKGPSPQKL